MPGGHRSAPDRAGRREGAEPYGLALDLSERQPEKKLGKQRSVFPGRRGSEKVVSPGLGCEAGTLPTPLTNAAERGTIEIEKESLPVRRLARFIYYLEKVADSLAGRLLFHAFEQFHHQCNNDSEYHQHNGEQLKITHEVTLPSTRLPTGGYVNRKFRLPGKGQPPENSGFALAKMQSERLQAVLPVDCASSLLCTVSWQTPAWYPMQF